MTSDAIEVWRRAFLHTGTLFGAGCLWPERVAAMQEGEPSLTARSTALQRAAHQLLERPLVFDDPVALPILGAGRVRWLALNLDRYRTAQSRALRAALVARSRFAEDTLAQSFAQGTRQYVVLGAGMDTFAYRNPHEGLRVFEVDHPSTQAWKQERLKESGIVIPRSLTFVPLDLERQSIESGLRDRGFRFDSPAVFSWLGVTMYLTHDAVSQTLSFVARTCVAGSGIVFDYSVPASELAPAQRWHRAVRARQVARIGEPWVSHFNTAELVRELREAGFTEIVDLDSDAVNARYFADRDDGFRLRGGSSRLIAARTAPASSNPASRESGR